MLFYQKVLQEGTNNLYICKGYLSFLISKAYSESLKQNMITQNTPASDSIFETFFTRCLVCIRAIFDFSITPEMNKMRPESGFLTRIDDSILGSKIHKSSGFCRIVCPLFTSLWNIRHPYSLLTVFLFSSYLIFNETLLQLHYHYPQCCARDKAATAKEHKGEHRSRNNQRGNSIDSN